ATCGRSPRSARPAGPGGWPGCGARARRSGPNLRRRIPFPPMSTVRLGLVGCGEVAREVHLPVLARVPEVDVGALADLDPASVEAAGSLAPRAARHTDAGALVADTGVEAVAVMVPPAAHRDVA